MTTHPGRRFHSAPPPSFPYFQRSHLRSTLSSAVLQSLTNLSALNEHDLNDERYFHNVYDQQPAGPSPFVSLKYESGHLALLDISFREQLYPYYIVFCETKKVKQ